MAVGAAQRSFASELTRGVIGGSLAGIVFIAITMWFADTMGDPADGPLAMISTIVKGDEAMMKGTASAGVGWAVHIVLSIFFGIVFAFIVKPFRKNGAKAIVGTLYGTGLYVINFLVLAPLAFPVFKMANQPFELLAHIVFGTLLSFAFFDFKALAAGLSSRAARPVTS